MIDTNILEGNGRRVLSAVIGVALLAAAAIVLLILLNDPSSESAEGVGKVSPATAIPLEDGSGLNRLTLTEKAVERLNVQTATVENSTVPYAAILYGLEGETYVYTNPEPLTYIRASVVVDHIEGDTAVLSEGPADGTAVVTTGAAELYGVDTGIGK